MSKLFDKLQGSHTTGIKHKIEDEWYAESKHEDSLDPLLMPDEERLKMEARRKAAARTGGRQSTILSGKIGGAADPPPAAPLSPSRPRGAGDGYNRAPPRKRDPRNRHRYR